MKFWKNRTIFILYTVTINFLFVQTLPSNTSNNGSESGVEFSGWKPLIIPEALTATEFAEKLEVANAIKNQTSSELEAADTKRSFILVYPPRAAATEQNSQNNKQAPQNTEARNPGPPLRSYPTQSRYHRMRNFGTPVGVSAQNRNPPAVYQRPKFPPVANPPPLPEHALRNRKKIPPNFTPESTSQHQVQIQLLDGYIVPPSGGGVPNNHAEKKTPQISTFPLSLNHVPEIRLLLPGDVHAQLNTLRQHPQQSNRHANPNTLAQDSDGGKNYQRDPLDKANIYSFESQRRPGRTVEYGNQNTGNRRPEHIGYNQNQENRKPDKEYSPPDSAVYPEAVHFPEQNNQNFQNTINQAVSYNHVKPYSGDELNSRVPNPSHTETRGAPSLQNYGGQLNPVSDSRTPNSHTKIHDATNGQGFLQTHGGQQNPASDGRFPISQTSIQDSVNAQGVAQNYGGHQNTLNANRTPVSQTKIHNLGSDQINPPNYAGQNIPSSDSRDHISHTRNHGSSNTQAFPQNYAGQLNPPVNNRVPVSQTHIHDVTNEQAFPQNYAGQINPAFDNRTPVHSKSHGTVNSQNYSPNFAGQQNPSIINNFPTHSKTQDSVNFQSYSPNVLGQQNPSVNSRPQNYPNNQNFGIQQKYEPEDTPRGQIATQPFQGTPDHGKNNFNPISNNNINYNPQNGQTGNSYISPQNYNRDGSVNTYQRGKINNNRGGFQNGWRATPSNRGGNQNYNPISVSKTNPGLGKTNFYSGSIDNQNRNTQVIPQHNLSNSNFSQFGNRDEPQKSHDAAFNPSNSDRDSRIQSNHQKSHGSNFSPSDSRQDSRTRPVEVHSKSVATQNLRGRRTSAEDASVNKPVLRNGKTNSDGSIIDDVYFAPPVLSQEEEQTQIDPFGGDSVSRDTVNTGGENSVNTGRLDGNLDSQKDISDFVTVDSGASGITGKQSDLTGGTDFCECTQNCAPIQRSPEENLGTTIRDIARSLNADAFFDYVGLTDEEIENTLASDGSYTFFIPSNEAVSRLPSNLIDHWKENNPDLRLALLNHVVRDKIPLDMLKLGGRMTSRARDATIFINNYHNEAVTVNGHRIVHGDVTAPKGGIIHVIDGTLCPVADQDIINTLRTCNKYDGFLTLADVTKLMDTMQEEGPYTVFLPSNEALTKIPADELAILKENTTVLREFLEYHIVRGAYFSGDLKDGQYLTTLYQRQPVRMGIRVDGCYRRLVEANNSPLTKCDIPTKNGVIHVIDWILRPSDLQWCEGVILP